jgi:hypothetical protein
MFVAGAPTIAGPARATETGLDELICGGCLCGGILPNHGQSVLES